MSKQLKVTFVIGYEQYNEAILERLENKVNILEEVQVSDVIDIVKPMQFYKDDESTYSEESMLVFVVDVDGYEEGDAVDFTKFMDYYSELSSQLYERGKGCQIFFGVREMDDLKNEPFEYIRQRIIEIDGVDIVQVDDVDFDDKEILKKLQDQNYLKDLNTYEHMMNTEADMNMFMDLVDSYAHYTSEVKHKEYINHNEHLIDNIEKGYAKYFKHILDENKYTYE